MLEPVGPLPEVVYWRRRAAALGALVVVTMLALWGLTALGGGDAEGEPRPAAAQQAPPPSAKPTGTSTAPKPTFPNLAGSGRLVLTPPAPPPPPPPPPPGPCPDESIGLTAQVGQPEYEVGQQPEFRLVVINVGPVPCIRDLDAALQEVLVFAADGTRLWSSNDCFAGDSDLVRTIDPGEELDFGVAWSGLGSVPGCDSERERVPPGDYNLVAQLGPLASPPTPFRLT